MKVDARVEAVPSRGCVAQQPHLRTGVLHIVALAAHVCETVIHRVRQAADMAACRPEEVAAVIGRVDEFGELGATGVREAEAEGAHAAFRALKEEVLVQAAPVPLPLKTCEESSACRHVGCVGGIHAYSRTGSTARDVRVPLS